METTIGFSLERTIILIGAVIFVLVVLAKAIRVVPQKTAFIVQRLGKYRATLDAGFHIIIPFLDKVAHKHTLREQALDVPPRTCVTKDNIELDVDGILYLQVVDPRKASYGINDYQFASSQLAQTTIRSVIGKIELDETFEARESINSAILEAVDKACDPWGVKVMRYEVKDIVPPWRIRDAMATQMKAEREKRRLIAESEGDKRAKINRAEGDKQEMIARSEGEKQKRINEAEGRATEIERIAMATAKGIREIATAIDGKGGINAVSLRVAEQYISEFGKLAKTNNSITIPSNLSDMAGVISTAMTIIKDQSNRQDENK